MIQMKEIHSSDVVQYAYVEQLLVSTFPPNEYRPLPQLKASADYQDNFHLNILLDDENPIGLIAYWDLDKFRYIEYFATDSAIRNKGYGTQVLQLFCNQSDKPVVLEIELPETLEAAHRKGFYERNNFAVWNNVYFQPPMREGDGRLQLLVCCYGELNPDTDFDLVKQTIHQEVYHFYED